MKPATQVEAEAAHWLARRDAGDWGPSDERALEEWAASSTAHRIAYLRLETAWAKADRLRALGPDELLSKPAEVADIERRRERRRWSRWVGGGLATAVAAASALWLFIGTGAEYATPIGGFQRVPLADDSLVELNTNTKIEVAYSDAERRIELDQGEAYFDVAKDRSRPFIVEAGDYRVIAVGTAFSVRLDSDNLDVLVTEGQVRIERDGIARAAAGPMLVSAGEMADIEEHAPIVSSLAPADYDHELGWREGVLVFDNRPLRDVAAEFNRYNRQQLVVLDPEVGAVTVGGTFRPTNLAGLTRLLEPGFGIEAVPAGNERIILRFAE